MFEENRKKYGKAKLIIARNVIPHVSELNSVISGVEKILSEDGIGVFEIHDANIIFNELHYDSVYHEHLFFTLKSLTYCLTNSICIHLKLKKVQLVVVHSLYIFQEKKKLFLKI